MIVRDEAAMLPGFLAAVAGLWDELVVADTGSRDDGPELVRAAGGRVVDFPWRDDFAAARNASLDAARGRWIVCLDADERPDGALRAALRELATTDHGAGAATVVMRNEMPDGGQRQARLLRCFRNDPQVRFRHRIHEDVADDVATYLARERLALRHLPGGVEHLGYVRSVAAARDKKARDTDLLRRALRDDPDDLYCRFKLLELARFWDDRELFDAEAEAARRALERTPRARLAGRPWSGDLAALVAQSLSAQPTAALAWLDRQAQRVEAGPAWHLRRGLLLEACGRAAEARAAFETCLRLLAAAGAGTGGVVPARPLLGLCRLAAGAGDLGRAADLAARAAAEAPRDPEALLAAVSFGPAGGTEFARRHLAEHPDTATPLAQALLSAGRPESALQLLEAHGGDQGDPLGIALLALVLGVEREVEISLPPEQAGRQLRSWLESLWASGRPDLRDALCARSAALEPAFPWLEPWLAGRLAALSPSRR
jgi:glycosyltransferase involved in cell wall biosynthesis